MLGEHGEIFAEVHVGEHFQDHIHAAPVGGREDLLRIVAGVMVEDGVGAFVREQGATGWGAAGGEDADVDGPRQLQGSKADAAR